MLLKEIIETKSQEQVFHNNIGAFHITEKRNIYNSLRKKYYDMALAASETFLGMWEQYPDTDSEVDIMDDLYKSLGPIFIEIRNDLMSMEIYDIDIGAIQGYASQERALQPFEEIHEKLIATFAQLQSQVDAEKNRREYNKDTRGRWTGTTINGTLKDDIALQLDMEARNIATGALYSAFNAIMDSRDQAKAEKMVTSILRSETTKKQVLTGVSASAYNLHHVLIHILTQRKGLDICTIPSDEEIQRAERLLNNLDSSALGETEKKQLFTEIFGLNPYSKRLYMEMILSGFEAASTITEIADLCGVDLKAEKERQVTVYLQKIIGSTEEEAMAAQNRLLQYCQDIDLEPSEEMEARTVLRAALEKFDIEYRTVDGTLFDTREEANIAKKEYPEIQKFMEEVLPPEKDSTLEYEERLLGLKEEFRKRFSSKLADKYLETFDKYLEDFDRIFCTISIFQVGTREEAARAKALRFIKTHDLSTGEKRAEALSRLRDYLPKVGLTEAQATEALDYLQKKETGNSTMDKISSSLGRFFKK